MTVAAAAAPSMFAVFAGRFHPPLIAQLVPRRDALTTRRWGSMSGARPSALAVGLTLIVTAIEPGRRLLAGVYVIVDRKRIMIVTCLIQAVTVG